MADQPVEKPVPPGNTGVRAAKTSKVLGQRPTGGRVVVNTQPRGQDTNIRPDDIDRELEDGGLPRNDELVARPPGTEGKRVRATKEAVDYRRKQVLRLILRGVPKETIAKHLGVTIRTVYEDVYEINADMRKELQNLDYPGFIGMSMAFYNEARDIALRIATDSKEPSNNAKMTALRTALSAEDSKHNFLVRVGLFRVAAPTDPFNAIQTGRHGTYTDENDLTKFLQLIAQSVGDKPAVIDVDAE